jgi:PAS domain S-box-containing protein
MLLRLRVLLLEDDSASVELLQTLIPEHQDDLWDVMYESQLTSALSRLQQVLFDVILLSLNGSCGHTLETIAILRRVSPDLPVVVLIDTDDDALGLEAIQHGAQDYLNRHALSYPLLERSLRYAIERLRNQKLSQQNEQWQQAEAALRQSEATNRAIIQAIPDLLIHMHANGGYQTILGGGAMHVIYPSPDISHPSVYDVLPEELAERRLYYAHRAIATGELQIYEQQIEIEGMLIWEEVRITELYDNEVLVIVRDITDRKQAETALHHLNQQLEVRVAQRTAALRESEERFRQIFEQSPVGIAISDLDGHLTRVNASLALIVGCSTAELLQQSIYTVLQSSEQKSPVQLQQLLDHTLTVTSFENQSITTDGKTRWVNVTSALIFNALGRPSSIIYLIEDISDRKHAEAELRRINEQLTLTNAELYRATRLKDEFLANMSHELRTPLNAILGMAEGLQEEVFGTLSDRQKRSIATIERSGQHLLELIDDILDLSKIEMGKLELQVAPISIHYLCETSLTFVRQQALKKQIRITTDIPKSLSDIVVDERRIRQVLINLLSNAIKFTPEGGSVRLVVQPQPSLNSLSFSVIDNGIGIASEDLKKLFQPFVQIDSSLNRQHAGTGLGLSLVRRLVELHRGTVTVDSELGQGSCFTVRLPYVMSVPSENSLVSQSTEVTTQIYNSHVLVIEDSIVMAEQIMRYLNEVGMQAYLYERGEGAIDAAIRQRPGLIILDLQLPTISGWDVLQQLKSHPQTQHIPVLVTSVVDEQAKGLSLGASAYLVKPINRNQLRKTLQQLHYLAQFDNSATAAELSLPPKTALSPLILLAEDNEANIVTISNYLTARGYRLILAKDGQSALDLVTTYHPDLILMDIQMPGMGGLEAIRHLRSNEKFAQVPIIVLTALAMPSDRQTCLEVGANDYFTKPVKLKHLVEKIQFFLEGR